MKICDGISISFSDGALREAERLTIAGIRPPRDESYIPDGAKDDSFTYLVIVLVLFLVALSAAIAIIVGVRKKRRHRLGARNARHRPPLRNSCSFCGASVSPNNPRCKNCGACLFRRSE